MALKPTARFLFAFALWVGLSLLPPSLPLAPLVAQVTPPEAPENVPACNEQDPQDFLIRRNYLPRRGMSREERIQAQENFRRSLAYRTENYGHFEGFGDPRLNDHSPQHYAERTEVFGLPVRLNRRIIPAVRCAEAEVARTCGHVPYRPVRLSGIRNRNTYHSHEVSNHVYGIALDIDPHLNTCCGCTARWREHPLCQRNVDSIFERMSMPECWVEAFEKYGFYWLGHDTLQDTMHFEFLGDPERILQESSPSSPETLDEPETADSEPTDPERAEPESAESG